VSSCVFCAIAAGEKTDQPIVAADEHTVAFLDARPVFKGHVLVIPRLHYPTLADLPPELTGPASTPARPSRPATHAGSPSSFKATTHRASSDPGLQARSSAEITAALTTT
jgi:histidine triad (HIT) family protein